MVWCPLLPSSSNPEGMALGHRPPRLGLPLLGGTVVHPGGTGLVGHRPERSRVGQPGLVADLGQAP